jgi:hypothetical protein
LDGKIDGTQVGEVARACGLKPTNAMVWKAAGQEYKRKGEKRITFEEWYPVYEQLSKEKVAGKGGDWAHWEFLLSLIITGSRKLCGLHGRPESF